LAEDRIDNLDDEFEISIPIELAPPTNKNQSLGENSKNKGNLFRNSNSDNETLSRLAYAEGSDFPGMGQLWNSVGAFLRLIQSFPQVGKTAEEANKVGSHATYIYFATLGGSLSTDVSIGRDLYFLFYSVTIQCYKLF